MRMMSGVVAVLWTKYVKNCGPMCVSVLWLKGVASACLWCWCVCILVRGDLHFNPLPCIPECFYGEVVKSRGWECSPWLGVDILWRLLLDPW